MYPRHKYVEPNKLAWQDVKNPHATLKYDGGHYYLCVTSDGTLKYYSRRESVKGGYPERSEKIPHLADKKMPEYAGQTFAVELIHSGFKKGAKESHSAAGGIINSLAPRAIQTQKDTGPIRAVLLDVINPPLKTYGAKVAHMEKFEKDFGKSDVLWVPPAARTKEEIVKLINTSKLENREGVVITSATDPEENNPRIKIKHYDTYNLRPVKMYEEVDIRGKPKGAMGAVDMVDGSGRVVATVGSGWNREQRNAAWKNFSEWSKDLQQVKTMGWGSVDGKLRQPVYNGPADGELDTI
jgi:hypothetical protein